jgi:hypothetical protein
VTGPTQARRFAEVLAEIKAPGTSPDRWTINFLANTVADWAGVSARQVTRWISGGSSPRADRWREPLTAALKELDSADRARLEPLLDALFATAQPDDDAAGARASVPDDLEGYLEWISDREYQERARRTPIPVRGLLDGGAPGHREIASSADPLSDLAGLLKQRGRPIRVRLAGPHAPGTPGDEVDHAGLDELCLRLAAAFARAFAAGATSTPLPLLVEWADLKGAALSGRAATLETLISDTLLGRETGNSFSIPDGPEGLRAGRMALIIRGIRGEGTDDERAWQSASAVLKEVPRLVAAWHGLEPASPGFFSHKLTLLLPPDILWTARECRRRLGEGNPDLPHLGTIAEGVVLLGTRPVGGRVLALIDQGALHPLALSSNSTLAASLLRQSILSLPFFNKSVGGKAAGDESPSSTLTLFPRRDDDHLLQTFLKSAAAEHARPALFGDFVSVQKETVKWVEPSFEGGLTFLEEWYSPSVNSARVLAQVDPEGNRLLACRPREVGDPEWEEVVQCVLDTLDGAGTVAERWSAVQKDWRAFEGALGYLRGVIDRNSGNSRQRKPAEDLRERALAVLKDFWDVKRPSENALGTVRYHGARAAAVLYDARQLHAEFCDIENTLSPADLGFASEIALRIAGRFYQQDGSGTDPFDHVFEQARTCADLVSNQLLDTIVKCRAPAAGQKDEHLELRHARYHAVAALVRLAPPPVLRTATGRLLPDAESGVVGRSENLRDFAIETATLLGGLRDTGAAWPMLPGPVARYLVDYIDEELNRYSNPPLYISAHRYLAYQAVSPMMLSSRRAKLLDDVYPTLPTVEAMQHETAALRYLLYYLRQEIAAGLLPDDRTIQFLRELHNTFRREAAEDDQPYSPEQRNRRDLAELIRWLP